MDNIEITDEVIESALICGDCAKCLMRKAKAGYDGRYCAQILASIIKSERAERAKNPGVWDCAPEWATTARVRWTEDRESRIWECSKNYARQPKKTKERELAEKTWGKLHTDCRSECQEADIKTIESAILEALNDKK